MRAIDSSVLVRLIIRDDPRQVAEAEDFVAHGAWVSTLALAETASALATVYDMSSKDLLRAIEMLLDHRELAIQDPAAVAEAVQLFRAKPTVDFSDCLMLGLARNAGNLPLGTFDRNLAKVAGTQKL